jgi:hypothetical protein
MQEFPSDVGSLKTQTKAAFKGISSKNVEVVDKSARFLLLAIPR